MLALFPSPMSTVVLAVLKLPISVSVGGVTESPSPSAVPLVSTSLKIDVSLQTPPGHQVVDELASGRLVHARPLPR